MFAGYLIVAQCLAVCSLGIWQTVSSVGRARLLQTSLNLKTLTYVYAYRIVMANFCERSESHFIQTTNKIYEMEDCLVEINKEGYRLTL